MKPYLKIPTYFILLISYLLIISPSAHSENKFKPAISKLEHSQLISQIKAASEEFKLTANDGTNQSNFGFSVSLAENRALVGAPGTDSNTGAVYVFDYINDTWQQTTRLEADDKSIDDYFGYSVSLSGNRALIGSYLDDNIAADAGAAYIFELSGDTWIQTAKLTASDAALEDNFGHSVSLLNDRALIGSYQTDEGAINSGSAYIFDLSAGSWNQTTKLLSDNPNIDDWLGYSVSLTNDRALLGARLDGINNEGAVYIFDLDLGNWDQTQKITNPHPNNDDQFGFTVSIENELAIVGVPFDDDNGINSGSVYVFNYANLNWTQQQKVYSTETQHFEESP